MTLLAYKSFLDPLVKDHPTITLKLKDRVVTGDLYNTTPSQVVLLVHGSEYRFEVISFDEIEEIAVKE